MTSHATRPFWDTATCREPAPLAHGTHTDMGSAVPGTTPLVAIALMEMAVSIVCGKKHDVSAWQSSLHAGEQEGRAGTMLGHGAPWGHAEMCHMARTGRWMDGQADGWLTVL